MFGSAILETLTGMVFIYAVMSLVIMTVNEQVASYFKWRANDLRRGITSMLDDKALTAEIYRHPLIYGLWKTKKDWIGKAVQVRSPGEESKCSMERPPSYIPSNQLAKAVLDIIKKRAAESQEGELSANCTEGLDDNLLRFKEKIAEMEDSQIRDVLEALCADSCKSIDDMEQKLSAWFDSGMERVSGWYRRKVQWLSIGVASVIVIGFNVDCLEMATKLYKDAGLRATLTVHAQSGALAHSSQQILDSMGALPVGWATAPWDILGEMSWIPVIIWIVSKVLGFVISVAAVTLGAPFWFDLLGRLMNVRLAGAKPAKAEEGIKPATA